MNGGGASAGAGACPDPGAAEVNVTRFMSSHSARACLNCAVVASLTVMPQSLSFVLSSSVALRPLNSAETSRALILDTSTIGSRSRLFDIRTTMSGATSSFSATLSMTSDITACLSRETSRRWWFGSITCTSIIAVRKWQKFVTCAEQANDQARSVAHKTWTLFRVYLIASESGVWSQKNNGGRRERRNSCGG